jgi:hypothetical protein
MRSYGIAAELRKRLLTVSPAALSVVGLAERVFLQNVLVTTASVSN